MNKVYKCGSVVKDVGKNLAKTKYMAKWGLLIDDERCVVTLKHSVLSNKKAIWFNDTLVKETQQFLSGDFDYAWSSAKHLFKVVISKDKKTYLYSLYVDDILFEDLPDFKKKDHFETMDIVNRLKNGPIIPSTYEEEAEEVEEVEEDENVEEENEFFSNPGGEENWLDFDVSPVVFKESEEDRQKREEADLKKKRVEEYTAGLVNLDFGF